MVPDVVIGVPDTLKIPGIDRPTDVTVPDPPPLAISVHPVFVFVPLVFV
jgi:hypothetical protein